MSKVFVVGEVGSNWKLGTENDFEIAEQLIIVAKEAGCDAVKFQYISGTEYVADAGSPHYLKEDINCLFNKLTLTVNDLSRLYQLCKRYDIEFMCSVFEPEDVPIVDKYVKRHKIPSYEACHRDLVNAVIRTEKPFLVSFGGYEPREILDIVAWLPKFKDITLMHCVASYPTQLFRAKLEALSWFNDAISGFNVGYSDHTTSVLAPAIAVAMGATVIEKHFTLSTKLPGPDHKFALDPTQLRVMVKAVRESEVLYNSVNEMGPDEQLLRNFAVRSVQAIKNIKSGDTLAANVNIGCKRPGNRKRGETGIYLYNLDGKKAVCDIPVGDGVLFSDVEPD